MFTVDRTAKPVSNAAQTLEVQQFEDPESQELFLQCLILVWHRDIPVFARQLEEHSNEAHFSTVKVAIKHSETLLQSQDDEVPDYEGKDEEDDYSRRQNPTKTPIIPKIFLERFLTVQLSTGCLKCATTFNFVFVHVQVIPDHGGKKRISLLMSIMDARQLP